MRLLLWLQEGSDRRKDALVPGCSTLGWHSCAGSPSSALLESPCSCRGGFARPPAIPQPMSPFVGNITTLIDQVNGETITFSYEEVFYPSVCAPGLSGRQSRRGGD